MSVRSFLDTNVLVYADDHDSPRKQKTATALIERCRREGSGVLSTQVLQEYFSATTRKLGVPAEIARRKLQLYARFSVVKIDVPDIIGAVDLHRLHRVSFWDALVIRAAQESGCSVLYTEDLHHGWEPEGLEVINPFRADEANR
jgi:predicted nucleic acid-binding protein